jgi:hypothetical protein
VTKLVLLLATAGTVAQAQFLSIGGKAGSPLKDPVPNLSPFSSFSPGRWTGGPTAEFHLPLRFSIEVDALYRSSRGAATFPYSFGPATAAYLSSSSQKTRAWDFPLLLKYHLLDGPVRPFVSAGYAWARESTQAVVSYTCLGPSGSCTPPNFNFVPRGGRLENTTNRQGPVAAAGIDFKSRRVTISPEARFTHLTRPNANQLTVFVGFTFNPFRR